MASTVISSIIKSSDGQAYFVTGTVGGTAHLQLLDNRVFSPGGSVVSVRRTPQEFAQDYADHYAKFAAILAALSGVSVNVPACEAGVAAIAVAFASDNTQFSQVGYDQISVAGTVATVATKIIVSLNRAIAKYDADATEFKMDLAKRMVAQRDLNLAENLSAADYIATFTTT